MSPTQRTLKYLRDQGYMAEVVEKWIPRIGVRRDLFGFIDIVAIDDTRKGVIGVQTTDGTHHAEHVVKVCTECSTAAARWLLAGNWALVLSWAKRGPRGKRKVWTLKETRITLQMLANGDAGRRLGQSTETTFIPSAQDAHDGLGRGQLAELAPAQARDVEQQVDREDE